MFFKIIPKRNKIFGQLLWKNCCKKLSKMVKYVHTGLSSLFAAKNKIFLDLDKKIRKTFFAPFQTDQSRTHRIDDFFRFSRLKSV